MGFWPAIALLSSGFGIGATALVYVYESRVIPRKAFDGAQEIVAFEDRMGREWVHPQQRDSVANLYERMFLGETFCVEYPLPDEFDS